MGRSEWACVVRSKADVRRVLQAAKEHNECEDPDQRGEDLACHCLLRFHGLPFLCLTNGGGRSYTNGFLWKRLPDMPVFWALSKPPGWHECEDYLWRVGEDEEEPSLDEVPVDALPLPDASPPGPLPAVPELGDWLTPTKPSDQFDLGMLIGGHPDAVGLSWTHDPETGQMVKRIIMRGERPSW